MKGAFELVDSREARDTIAYAPELTGQRIESCGGLRVLPPHLRPRSRVFSNGCYICRDPEYALAGLPLCRECPKCGGHIAADDSLCDSCGHDDCP